MVIAACGSVSCAKYDSVDVWFDCVLWKGILFFMPSQPMNHEGETVNTKNADIL